MTVFKKHITHDSCPLFSTEFLKISSCIAGPKFPGWKGFSELSENWWTEKRPEEALRVAAFLRFLQELFCQKKRGCQTCPRKQNAGLRFRWWQWKDLGGWFYLLPLIFLGMIFGHLRQSHWPPAGPQPLGENHIGFVAQCRIGNHEKTPGKLVNWRKKNDLFFLCVCVRMIASFNLIDIGLHIHIH